MAALPYRGLVLDGEVVVHDARGIPSFDLLQKRGRLHPGHVVGTGKIADLRAMVAAGDADIVIVDHEISPSQLKNLEIADFQQEKDSYTTLFFGSSHVYRQVLPETFDRTMAEHGVQTAAWRDRRNEFRSAFGAIGVPESLLHPIAFAVALGGGGPEGLRAGPSRGERARIAQQLAEAFLHLRRQIRPPKLSEALEVQLCCPSSGHGVEPPRS